MKSQKLFCTQNHILHGGDYNPDQWLEYPEIIDNDFRLMKLANCQTFSIGIFSWGKLEIADGVFDFAWLDNILDCCAENNIKVFLATPSGARPPWMAKKYPECLRVDINGKREFFRMRHNLCFSAPVVLEKVRTINEKLAERYSKHPALLGWHLSNEYSGECFCEHCLKKFYTFLEKKYGTVEELNRRTWSAFWSHTFTSFDEIDPRDPALEAIQIDWKRFSSQQMADFMAWEKAAVRKFSNAPVTTNMMGLHDEIDYYRIAGECDFIADDCYPMWYKGTEKEVAARYSMFHDLHYAMQNKPFVMMESAPGVPNFRPHAHLRRPGELQREMLLAIGHGADGTMYFQWRKSRGGFEKFHGAVVGHDNSENGMTFKSVADYGRKLEKLSPVAGSVKKIDCALLWDWDNFWSLRLDYTHNFKDVKTIALKHYRALWENNFSIGVYESTNDSFMQAKMVVAPMLFMLKPGVKDRLKTYVANGGTLILTHQFAYVNEDSLCLAPNEISDLCGFTVEDIDCMEPEREQSVSFNGRSIAVHEAAELINVTDCEVAGVYEKDFYAGTPAILKRNIKKGTLWYLGANFDLGFLQNFYADTAAKCNIKNIIPDLPSMVTSAVRYNENVTFVFLYNWGENAEQIKLPHTMYDIFADCSCNELTLGINGSCVLKF
ncbi:MAG: beta-galactosidase [Lentisphaeria bacterium]|nr:beta-galactosidase [Lentisphaeria bacterium]